MIASWMLHVLLVSALIGIGGRALEELCRLAGWPPIPPPLKRGCSP